MKKYVLLLIDYDIMTIKLLIRGWERRVDEENISEHAKKRINFLSKKLNRITKYREKLEKTLQ